MGAGNLMAQKGRKGRRFTLRKVRVQATITLSTLAAKDLLAAAMIGVSTSDYRIVSTDLTWGLNNLTEGDGPILVGLAHGDYNDAEVEEAIEVANINQATKTEQEQANRLVRDVAILGAQGAGTQFVANGGEPIKTRLNWRINTGKSVSMWAYNLDTAAMQTGAIVTATGHVWVKDL